MKTFYFCAVITVLLFPSNIDLSTYSQDTVYHISHNELIVGDTCILLQHVGYCDTNKLVAMLIPDRLYWPDYCPGCMPDTFYSFRTETAPETDTSFHFYFMLPLGTLSGGYDVIHLCDGSPMLFWTNVTVYTPPMIWIQPRDTTVCAADNAVFSVNATGNKNENLTYDWYHNDVLFSSTTQGDLIIEQAGAGDTGRYYCVISNPYGMDTTETVRLDLHPFPAHPGTPDGPDRVCSNVENTAYTIHSDPLATGYSWHLLPMEAGDTSFRDTVCTVHWNPAFSGTARLYVELLSGNCGKNTSDTLEISVSGIAASPEICIVGIDEQIGRYRITWERSAFGAAQLFRVYRESNEADVYLEIGTVDTSKFSFFVDSSSLPDVLPHRYKISYVDSCGIESGLSPFHQTMHLVANTGTSGEVNLIWSAYVGIAFPTYTIFRGTHPDSMSLLIQVPSTVTSYKDLDPPVGKIYYQIGMSNPAGCDPIMKSGVNYSSSMSNIDQVLVTGVDDVKGNQPFILFPNPVNDVLQIRYDKVITFPVQLTVYNALGQAVLDESINTGEIYVDVSTLQDGIYILQMLSGSEHHTTRFVINRE